MVAGGSRDGETALIGRKGEDEEKDETDKSFHILIKEEKKKEKERGLEEGLNRRRDWIDFVSSFFC